MENFENVGMEIASEEAANVATNNVGKTVGKVLLIGTGVALAIKGGIWVGKKIAGAIKSKKAGKAKDVVDTEYEEVPADAE